MRYETNVIHFIPIIIFKSIWIHERNDFAEVNLKLSKNLGYKSENNCVELCVENNYRMP